MDRGLATQTGGRLKQLETLLRGGTFMMTYGDGMANVNIQDLVSFHCQLGKLATITAVRPPARFGKLNFRGDLVTSFEEKPQIGEGWINGGFFVQEPQVLDYIEDDTVIWEREPLERLAQDGQLVAFRHEMFWQCMDTWGCSLVREFVKTGQCSLASMEIDRFIIPWQLAGASLRTGDSK